MLCCMRCYWQGRQVGLRSGLQVKGRQLGLREEVPEENWRNRSREFLKDAKAWVSI